MKKSKILRGLELVKKQSGYAKKNSGLLPTLLCLAEASSKNRIIWGLFWKKLCDLIAVENRKSNEIGGSIECAQKYAAATN